MISIVLNVFSHSCGNPSDSCSVLSWAKWNNSCSSFKQGNSLNYLFKNHVICAVHNLISYCGPGPEYDEFKMICVFQLYNIIQQLQPDLNFTLTVKNITEVWNLFSSRSSVFLITYSEGLVQLDFEEDKQHLVGVNFFVLLCCRSLNWSLIERIK